MKRSGAPILAAFLWMIAVAAPLIVLQVMTPTVAHADGGGGDGGGGDGGGGDGGGGDGGGGDGGGGDGGGDDGGGDDGGGDGSDGGGSGHGSDGAGHGDDGGSGGHGSDDGEGDEGGDDNGDDDGQNASPQAATSPGEGGRSEPDRAPREIVARGLSRRQTAALVAQGYKVLDRADLVSIRTTVRRLHVPDTLSVEEARDNLRALSGPEAADFNHYYRANGTAASDLTNPPPACKGVYCAARDLINWPEGLGPRGCGTPVTIGMVDTGLNTRHAVLTGADIEVIRAAPEEYSPAEANHGTAVASILVGRPESRVPGLLPGQKLVAVDAFHRQGRDQRADVFSLVRALDLLAKRGARIINLSLAGPPDKILESTLRRLIRKRNIAVIAAAGNGGPHANPAYPAAYDGVIAVTAVDSRGIAYRRAGRGPYVDFAAQGVKVWAAASVKGARWKTGTSFAAPFVTAAVALWRQIDPTLTPDEIRRRLAASARDVGPAGRDQIYGYGVPDLGNACPGTARYLPASAD